MNQALVDVPQLWLLVLSAYLLGSIPFGYLLVRLQSGGDIRSRGSGNIGATNVARTSGWFSGVVTLSLDVAKGAFAVWMMGHFSSQSARFMMYAGIAAIVGHLYPVWLGFVGGKGVATTLGVFLMLCWPAAVAALAIFLLVILFWRYVSLASISAASTLPILMYVLYAPRHAPPTVISVGTLFVAILIIFKHRANIERLLAGNEPPFGIGSKKS